MIIFAHLQYFWGLITLFLLELVQLHDENLTVKIHRHVLQFLARVTIHKILYKVHLNILRFAVIRAWLLRTDSFAVHQHKFLPKIKVFLTPATLLYVVN